MSPHALLNAKLGMFKTANLSSYVNSFNPGIPFDPLRSTPLISVLSFSNLGAHATLQYSRCGLTSDVNNNLDDSLSKCSYDPLMSPRILFALLTCISIYWENLSEGSILIPRSFSKCVFFLRLQKFHAHFSFHIYILGCFFLCVEFCIC